MLLAVAPSHLERGIVEVPCDALCIHVAPTSCSMPENPECMPMRPTAISLEDSTKEWQQEHIENPVELV